MQESIANTDTQSGFICMYNQEGIELCHPNPALIGQQINISNSGFTSEFKNQLPFSKVLNSGKAASGIRDFPESKKRSSEIVSVYPVQGSNWMLASHANTSVLNREVSNLYQKFILVFICATLLILTCSFFFIRIIYKKYEALRNQEITDLNIEINSLSTLNEQLNALQEKYSEYKQESVTEKETENWRKRIITYQKDELISLETHEIAYFFLEDNYTYIKTFKGKQYAINSSLDDLIKTLDLQLFYRANRQFIINIKAIASIFVYGKNQLKLIVEPPIQGGVVISKNKVAEFKNWLEQ